MKNARDRALLLIGFAGGFRRSEIVGLDRDDVERDAAGVEYHAQALEDRPGRGGTKDRHPSSAERATARSLRSTSGSGCPDFRRPVFRPVDRHGRVASERLSGEAVSLIVNERVAAATSTRRASPATACAPASPPAPSRWTSRPSRSDRRLATPRTRCSRATYEMGSSYSGTPTGRCSERCDEFQSPSRIFSSRSTLASKPETAQTYRVVDRKEVFVAYPARDQTLSAGIMDAVRKANALPLPVQFVPWPFNDIAGNQLISPIQEKIDRVRLSSSPISRT